jgi:hypothetical protein
MSLRFRHGAFAMKFSCKSCEAIRQWAADYADPSIICPICQASARLHSAVPGMHMARPDEYDGAGLSEGHPPTNKKSTSGGSVGAGTGKAANVKGRSRGMIVLILGGLLGCCVCLPATLVGVSIPIVNKVKEADEKARLLENMKVVATGNNHYHQFNRHYPSPQMQPLHPEFRPPELSWRVSVVENGLYATGETFKLFDRTQSWDHPNNVHGLRSMPFWYSQSRDSGPEFTETAVQYFTGPKTAFPDPLVKLNVRDLGNGISNTFMCAQASSAVPWSKPADMVIGEDALPLPASWFAATTFDGSARIVNRATASDRVLRMAIDPKNNERFPPEWGE